MAENSGGFDPGRYLTKVTGRDYLEVKWRLVWLRTNEPGSRIETELVSLNEQQAVFKATVTLPSGASSSGYGSETPRDFNDFIEKAETKAVGRALGMLGYGTQFSYEFDEVHRVVDSPVAHGSSHQESNLPPRDRTTTQNAIPHQNGNGQQQTNTQNGQGATPKQLQFIQSIARDRGMTEEQLASEIGQLYGCTLGELDRRDASAYIERLQSRRNVTN